MNFASTFATTRADSARVVIDPERVVADISPLLFGGFAEHLGRCIYGGLYDPASPHADEAGFRKDVLAALRELDFSTLRYPGGNFVSGYSWRDGVGPRGERPRRRELAWQSIETNQFGTDEFLALCRKLDTRPMLGLNFGTAGVAEAADLVEYCNAPAGTRHADLRVRHGHPEPYGVKYWCLGNEMDGPWQIGRLDAIDYGKKAREAAKVMKWMDPAVQLILCGSSNSAMPTYPEWDRVALELAWEQIDYHAMHYYAANRDDDTASFLALPIALEAHIDTLAATLRYVKARLRSKRDVYLCWDEWNVWYKDQTMLGHWQEAPHLLEEVYNLEDALLVAQWLGLFLRKCDVLKIACLAQVVNVIAPILTTRDALLRQSTFYPFQLFRRLARGQSLDLLVQSPTYPTKAYGEVPVLDASASLDPATGRGAVFLVNRSREESLTAQVVYQAGRDDPPPRQVAEAWQISGEDPKAANSFEQPEAVVPRRLSNVRVTNDTITLRLPPLSFTALGVNAGA